MTELTADRLRELLRYEPETGNFIRLVRTSNKINVGDIAGCVDAQGYIKISVDGVQYYAHRLAFLYMIGRWPDPEGDHEDTDQSNNRWVNLREANSHQNKTNRGARSDNQVGLKGVCPDTRYGGFRANIFVNGKQTHLGKTDCPAAAHFLYIIASDKAFGRFARSS